MSRAVPLALTAAVVVAGFSFAAAQPAESPELGRFRSIFHVGYEVILTEAADGSAFHVELLLSNEEAKAARQAHEAAIAKAAEAQKAFDEADTHFRDLRQREPAERNLVQDEGLRAYKTREETFVALRAAQTAIPRPVRTIAIAAEDYFSYEEDGNLVHVPFGRVVAVTQRKR